MLSSVSFSACTPVGLTYTPDAEFKVTQNLYAFADGFNMYIAPVLKNPRDVTLNKHEIAVLSDYVSVQDCIDQNRKSDSVIEFATSIEVSSRGFWFTDGSTITLTPDKLADGNVFTFLFNPLAETVQVIFQDDKYLTYDDQTNLLSFEDESLIAFNGVSPQTFKYILDGNQVVMFTNFAFLTAQHTLVFSDSGVLSATASLSSNGQPLSGSVFTLAELPDVTNINSYLYGQSNWVQYKNNTQDLSIKKSISGISQNVLVTAPYKTLSGDQLKVNLNGLKNHLTPDYEQNIDAIDNVKQRDYYGLFTGTNQEEGYENVFLAYEGGTQGINFKKDKFTWFHYPNTSTSINVNDTTISLNGAIASNTPFKSDKVFKKQANYKKYSNWGESLPIYQQNGTWLCTWLSGSPDPETIPVWMDRYINPTLTGNVSAVDDMVDLLLTSNNGAFITTTELSGLEINGQNYVAKLFKNYQQAYIDTPSQLTFDPGVLYVYHHLGEANNRTIVSNLSGGSKQYFVSGNQIVSEKQDGTEQMLFVGNWSQGVTTDNSPFFNDVTLVNDPLIRADTQLVYNTLYTNASGYGITKTSVNLAPYEGFSLVANVSAADWSKLYGDQIIGNYFDGGIGIFVNNPVLTPLFYLYEISQGRNLQLNSDLYIVQENKLSNVQSASALQFIFKRDYDQEYFVIDSAKNVLRYDSANILLSASNLASILSGNIVDAQIDGLGNIYILTNYGGYKYAVDSGTTTFLFGAGNSTRLAVDLNSNVKVLQPNVVDYCVDSLNNIFTITSTSLLKNGNIALSGTDLKKVNCDIDDNIWILHNNKLTKLSNVPGKISTTTLSTSGAMSMCFGYNLKGTSTREEYVIVVDETNKVLTKLNTDNQVLTSIPLTSLSGQFVVNNTMSFRLPRGDVNGYDFQRKYSRIKQKQNGIHVKVFTNHNKTLRSKIFTVNADVSQLTSGWHNLIATFDTSHGNLKLYIDGELVGSSSSDINAFQYSYRVTNYRNEPRLLIGSSSAKNGTLSDTIRQSGSYIFDGVFNEIRLYNSPLNEENSRYAARNGYVSIYDDMVWNMPVGSNQYLEEIERFFQHRLPGNKSQFFNLKIRGYKPTNTDVQTLFEENIRQVITKIVPAYTQLKDIVWVS